MVNFVLTLRIFWGIMIVFVSLLATFGEANVRIFDDIEAKDPVTFRWYPDIQEMVALVWRCHG